MVNLGSGKDSPKTVTLSFRLPYFTNWGESLLVCGSEPVLGSWNLKQGLSLIPVHQGNELIWYGTIKVPSVFECEYSYYLVDDNKKVLRWEAGTKRQIVMPEGIRDGEVIELHDLWKTASEELFFRSAFKDVIFHKSRSFVSDKPVVTIQKEQGDSVIVHFSVSCPKLEEGTSVYVIGSSTQLGRWKIQYGIKLSYAGESSWEANCAIPKNDLPIKYPFCLFS